MLLTFGIARADPCDTLVIPPSVGVGAPTDVTALNQLLANATSSQEAAGYLYASLIFIDRNDRIDFSHSIATGIEALDNNARYRVTMRPWRWSDGAPVTADDVLFTSELIKELGTGYISYGQGGVPQLIAGLKVLNPEQFEITLTQPVNPLWFEMNGLSQLVPLPRHAWGKLSVDQLWEHQSDPKFFAVVDGEFKIDKFDMGRSISFVPNPRYPLEHAPFKRMVVKFVQSGGAELQGVQAGELDLANLPHEAYEARNSVKNAHLVPVPPTFGYAYIAFNFKNPGTPFFRDLRVRQAIQDSIDEKTMISALWHGLGVEGYGPVPAIPPSFLSPNARAGHYPVGYDPGKAARLLEDAGYLPGPDGIRAKGGVKLEFTLLIASGTSTSLMMAQMMQPYLRKSGIAMHIQQEDFNQMLATLERGVAPWQAYMLEWSDAPYPSGETIFNTGGGQNFGGYSDPKMDRLIEDSANKPGLDALYQFQDYASEQLPYIFLPEPADAMMVRNGIGGIDRLITPGSGYSPQLLTLDRKVCDAAH